MLIAPAFRLIRAIFVDSYRENAIEEIRLPGHLSLTGENGSGKTTLLRVLPVFFGEAPNRVIRKEGDQEGFVRHYLPRVSAYIVFEYERHGALMLAVMHTAAGPDKATYQFIDSPYRQEFFVLPDDTFVHAGKLKQHVESLGVSVSERLTHDGYRQVIQNNPSREHSKLAARFAFSNKQRGLQHVERVMTAVLQRETSFFDLKRMIITSVRGNEDAFRLHLDRHGLVRWVEECEAYLDIMSYKETVVALGEKDLGRIHMVKDLKYLYREFLALRHHLENEEEVVLKLRTTEREQRDLRLRALDEEIDQIRTQFEESSAKAKAARKLAHGLADDRRRYEADGMDEKRRKVDQIPTLNAQLERCATQLAILGDAQRPILKQFEDIEATILDEKYSMVSRFSAQELEITRTAAENSQQARDAFDSATSDLDDLQREEISTFNESVEAATSAASTAKATQAAADQSLLKAWETARTHLQACLQAQADAVDQHGLAEKAHRSATAEFVSADANVQRELQRIESLDGEISHWYAYQTPGEDTLLAHLRQHYPEWSQDIGKVINDRVLLRTDLSPAITDGNSFYGLSIALDRIAREDFSDEQEIVKRIADLIERKELATRTLEEVRILASKAADHVRVCEKSLEAAQVHLAQSKVAVTNSRRNELELESLVEKSLQLDRERIAEEVTRASAQLKTSRENRDQAKARHQQDRESLLNGYQGKIKALERNKISALKAVELERQLNDSKYLDQIRKCKEDRDRALTDKGISPDLLHQLSSEQAVAEKQLGAAEKCIAEVESFLSWLKTAWPQHDEHLSIAVREDQVAQTRKTALNDRQVNRQDYLRQIEVRLNQLEERLRGIETQRRTIEIYLDDMALWRPDEAVALPPWQPTMIIESLIRRQKEAKKSLRDLESDIRDGIEEIRTALNKYPSTTIGQFYRQLISTHGVPRPAHEHEWIQPLREWFIDDHTQALNGLLQQGRSMAQSVDEFRKQLADFDQHVRNFHRDLQSSLDGNVRFARIQRVQVRIRTRLDEQDYWNTITHLSAEYSEWVARGTVALPEQSFMDAARRMANTLREGKGLITEPADLIEIEVEANIQGRERPVVAKTEQQLAHLSSTGLSYLILCMVLIGFLKRIIRDAPVELIWPVDELRDLDLQNTRALVETLTQNGITLASAFPDPDPEILAMIKNRYHVRDDRRIYEVALQEADHV